MNRLLTLLSFAFIYSSITVHARPCIAFDAGWNLLAFGLNGKDYNAGTQDKWGQGSATEITASGRPPFDGSTTTCYLSQFGNAIYVMNGDTSNPATIHIYDATAKSWSAQQTTPGSFDLSNFGAILDHDTNLFYAISRGNLFSLDMQELKAATGSAISWVFDKPIGFDTTNYQPVMALAENHIHFLNAPGVPAGSAEIFVIHFSWFQPTPQHYGDFPATHGQAFSIFRDSGVQQEFAFIPDDGSATYVINVDTNTTQRLPGPSTKDSSATYFASSSAFVQLSLSSGSVNFFPYNPSDAGANQNAGWTAVSSLAGKVIASPSSSSGTSPSASSGTSNNGPKTSSSNTAKGASATGSNNHANGGIQAFDLGFKSLQLGIILVGLVLLM